MSHEYDKEQSELLYYGELADREKEEAEAHLRACTDCRAHLDELKKLHGVLAHYSPMKVSDNLLHDARAELWAALRNREREPGVGEWLTRLFSPVAASRYRFAFAGAATIAAGFFLGYLVFKTPTPEYPPQETTAQTQVAVNEERPMLPEGGQITNVRFLNSDVQKGDVEFTFDAIMPMHLKGKVNDPQIQQVLSYALLNEQNPGTRLRSVNAMASEQVTRADEEVKKVLIAVLRSDDNPGVRREALSALQKFRSDNDIKRAFMDALSNDSNSAIRIDAINALKSAKPKDIAADQELLNVFREILKSDNNPYVRIQAKAVLQEIKK